MGAITSKASDSHNKKEQSISATVTPKQSKVLPFDPRSPSEQINRTPITVGKTPDCDRTLNQDATLRAVTSQILFDPRSPSIEVSRTPIMVEEKTNQRMPLRPSRLAELQSTPTNYMCKTDPRSPTDKVPRTPIEEKIKDENGAIKKELMDASNVENTPKDKLNGDSKFPYERDRQPLTVIGNENPHQNASDVSGQNNSLEEEFSKNENAILNKLGTENCIKSDTTFVETI